MKRYLVFLFALPCFGQATLTGTASISGHAALTVAASSLPQINCIVSPSQNCSSLTVAGDAYSPGKFSGNADPTMRTDPNTGTLWMCYSWPRTVAHGTKVVDIHCAYNAGPGWTNSGLNNAGHLYTTQTVSNGVTGAATDQTSNEVMEILPMNVSGTTYWMGIHSQYQVPLGGKPPGYSYTLRQEFVACAGTATQGPMCLLGAATPQWLGGTETNQTYWPLNVNLTTLSGTSCPGWREPTFNIQGGLLLLTIDCSDLSAYYQFSTSSVQTCGPLGTCSWAFVAGSQFATPSQMATICSTLGTCANTEFFTQAEISASAVSGTVICGDAVHINGSGAKVADAIFCAPLLTVTPPTWTPTISVLAKSTQSLAVGPGTAAYDKDWSGGLVFAFKNTACTAGSPGCSAAGGNFSFLVNTGLFP